MIIKTLQVPECNQFTQILVTLIVHGQENDMVGIGLAISCGGFFTAVPRRHVSLTSNDRFNPCFFGFSEKLNRPEHIAMVCDGHSFHAQFQGLIQHLIDTYGAVKQAEFGVNVKVNKLGILGHVILFCKGVGV